MNLIEQRREMVGEWIVAIMKPDDYVKKHNLQRVSSIQMYETSSQEYDHKGLYSEEIFGPVGSDQRYKTCGYIQLNIEVMNPLLYETILSFKRYYQDIISGRAYAVFDEEAKDLVLADKNTPGAGKGYTFFKEALKKIEFKKSNSATRSTNVDNLIKYQDRLWIKHLIVLPAALRDVVVKEEGLPQIDEVNEFYRSAIILSKTMEGIRNPGKMYDAIMYQMQLKVFHIFCYMRQIMSGKKGRLQSEFASRAITLGTRNTISPITNSGESTDDPKFIHITETGMPLYQASAAFKPIVYYEMQNIFMTHIFPEGSVSVSVIDPKDYSFVVRDIPDRNIKEYTSSEGINSFIGRFKNMSYRSKPVAIKDEKGKFYYLFMTYEDGDDFYIFRNLDEFRKQYEKSNVKDMFLLYGEYTKVERAFSEDKDYVMTVANKRKNMPTLKDPYVMFTTEKEREVFSTEYYAKVTNIEYKDDGVRLFTFKKIKVTDIEVKRKYDATKARPLTYGEMLYIATYVGTQEKYISVTRYPVNHVENTYTSLVHLTSTEPCRTLNLKFTYDVTRPGYEIPRMPVANGTYNESLLIHSSRLDNIGGDFDGDQSSANSILSNEANEENAHYHQQMYAVVKPNGKLVFDVSSDIINHTLYNLTKVDNDYFKKAEARHKEAMQVKPRKKIKRGK